MRFSKVCCCLIFLLVLGIQNLWGQKWLWVKQNINKSQLSNNVPVAIATDPTGNIFETGQFQDTVIFGSYTISDYTTASLITYNSYVVKYSPAGNVQWALCNNRSQYENMFPQSIATDSKGNAYITGTCTDYITFGTSTFYPGGNGYFIAKIDPNGNVLWLKGADTLLPGNAYGQAIATDKHGGIYVTGTYTGYFSLGSFNYPTPPADYSYVFVAKYDSNGNVLWINYGETQDISETWNHIAPQVSITSDGASNIYVAGVFMDTIVFGSNLFKSVGAGNNVFMVKYDSGGNLQWATSAIPYGNASGIAQTYSEGASLLAVTTDIYNNIYLTAGYNDTLSFGAYKLTEGTNQDLGTAFLVKYNSMGTVDWAKSVNPTSIISTSFGRSVTTDKWGNVYWSGLLQSSFAFDGDTLGSWAETESFLIKLDSNAKILCKTTIKTDVGGLNILVASDPLAPNVYFSCMTNIVPTDTTFFGNYYIIGSGGFMSKWTCDTCKMNDKIIPLQATICSGQSTTLAGAGGPGYVWNTGSTEDSITVTPLVTTTYTLYVSNGICYGDTSVTIEVNQSPIPSFTYKGKICIGKPDTITASGGNTYQWNNGDTVPTIIVNPTSNTTYSIIIANNLCSVKDSVNVQVFPYPVPVITSQQYICPGQSATISASGGTDYLWSTGDTTSTISVAPVSTTIFSLTISNGVCTVSDSSTVIVNPSPTISVCCDSNISPGESVQLVTSGGQNFKWSPSTALSCDSCPNPIASPTVNITYTLTIVSDSGCVSIRTITIDVSCGNVFIPTAFSPNEPNNSILYVRGPCIASIDFLVFDRWGNKVFESQNTDKGWDGTYKGQPMNMGTYVWFLKATMQDGANIEKNGNVTLVR